MGVVPGQRIFKKQNRRWNVGQISIYLNNAAGGWPKAPGVAEAVAGSLSRPPRELGRTSDAIEDDAAECRDRLAALLGADSPDRIVLTANATHALNIAILGLERKLNKGAVAVTTAAEHNSVLRPLRRLEAERGLKLEIVPLAKDGGGLDEEAFMRALGRGPALVALTHASNVTGRIFDAKKLLGAAKAAGAVTLLDAAQSLGNIDVKPAEIPADIVAFTGHKGLHGPTGAGGLYVSPGIELEQVMTGGTGIRSELALHPPEMPLRHEAGTHNAMGLAGLAAALRWHKAEGVAHREKAAAAADRLRKELRAVPGLIIFDDEVDAPRTGVISFRIHGWTVEDAGHALSGSFGIVCRAGLHCAPLIH